MNRLVPEVADITMQHAGADAINWQDKDKSPQKIFRLGWPAMLDAAPHAGRVSREAVERAAEAMWQEESMRARERRRLTLWEDESEMVRAIWRRHGRAAIAALGLEIEEAPHAPAGS